MPSGTFRRGKKLRWVVMLAIIIILFTAHRRLSWKPFGFESLKNVSSYNDSRLLTYIRGTHITPPTGKNVPYNFSKSFNQYKEHDEFHAKLLDVLERLNLKSGFYVEAGALDGQYLSHTLDLEQQGWQGLLVEASPSLVKELKAKQRKAWIADVCLTEKVYLTVDFITIRNQSHNWLRGNGKSNPVNSSIAPKGFEGIQNYKSEGEVECFALQSILKSINVEKVDLLVLDIEGGEFRLLHEYPFQDLPIKVIAVEYWLIKEPYWMLIKHMRSQGYQLEYKGASDMIFVQKSMT